MRKGLCGIVLCTVVCAVGMRAQTAKEAVAELQSSIGSSQLVLRNFSGEDKVLATWTGTRADLAPARWHTMGVLQLQSIKLSGNRLTLQCIRHAVVKDSQDKLSLHREPTEVQIDVDLRDADPTVVLPKIKNDLFFASVGDAVDEIPKDRKNSVPANIDKSPAAAKVKTSSSDPPCDCAVKDEAECGSGPFQRLGMVPPKFLKGKDPEFTDEARRGFMDAHVEVGLQVDKLGRPYDVWVLRSVGRGLDEAAAKSVLTYVFRPATCHDSPVDVYLNVDVRFQRY